MKLFNLHIMTTQERENFAKAAWKSGHRTAEANGYTLQELVQAKEESYNQGKADGIKASKRAFALAIKQKGESNNDIL